MKPLRGCAGRTVFSDRKAGSGMQPIVSAVATANIKVGDLDVIESNASHSAQLHDFMLGQTGGSGLAGGVVSASLRDRTAQVHLGSRRRKRRSGLPVGCAEGSGFDGFCTGTRIVAGSGSPAT